MKNGKWVVDVKGEALSSSFEISVVREDYTLGFQSYGWFEMDRKQLISHNGGPCQWPLSQRIWDKLLKVAEEVAVELNHLDHKT